MQKRGFELKLFSSYKEIAIFLFLIIALFSYNIYQKYQIYQELKSSKFCTTEAVVLKQYKKIKSSNKSYFVLKIKSKDGYSFYTTNYEELRDISGRDISITFITDRVDFKSFLSGFYAPSFDIRVYEKRDSLKEKLEELISSQHNNHKTKELFLALFLAKPISKELRDDVSNLGISHLIAISGFHLGVLFTILYFILSRLYIYFQDRYFPYRNRRFDLTVLILIFLFGYMYMLGFVPSVVRSFCMMAFGFFLYHRSFRIISFEVLFVTVLFIVALTPEFIFSIGFWFSVCGVFYIYLFLHHFSYLKGWQIFLLLNFWVYFAMLPIIHYIFPNFTIYQLFSPFLTMLFSIFYPLEMFLHLIGLGDLLDTLLLKLFFFKATIYQIKTPFWFLVLYLLSSIFAIFHKGIMFTLLCLDLLFFLNIK